VDINCQQTGKISRKYT